MTSRHEDERKELNDSAADNEELEIQCLLRSAVTELNKANPQSPIIEKIADFAARFSHRELSAPVATPPDMTRTYHSPSDFDMLIKTIGQVEEELRIAKMENSELKEKVEFYDSLKDEMADSAREEFEHKLMELQHDFLKIDAEYHRKNAEMEKLESKLHQMDKLLSDKDRELQDMEYRFVSGSYQKACKVLAS